MQVSIKDVSDFNLNLDMLDGDVRWRTVKRGGQFICHDCGTVAVTIGKKEDNREYEGCAPKCPNCGGKCKLKGATPTSIILATIQLKNEKKFGAVIKKNPKEKGNPEIFKQVVLGRLNRSVNGEYNFTDFNIPGCENIYVPDYEKRQKRGVKKAKATV